MRGGLEAGARVGHSPSEPEGQGDPDTEGAFEDPERREQDGPERKCLPALVPSPARLRDGHRGHGSGQKGRPPPSDGQAKGACEERQQGQFRGEAPGLGEVIVGLADPLPEKVPG